MPDLLVKLYDLKPTSHDLSEGYLVRRAMAYEKTLIVDWVRTLFGNQWADECSVAFAKTPIACFIALHNQELVGFACYDVTCKNVFGPMGVHADQRRKGLGRKLLFKCLKSMLDSGYGYAVIGSASDVDFYSRAVGAIIIPGSDPGIYPSRIKS